MRGPGATDVPAAHARYPLIDGLRALAALGVFVYHVDDLTPVSGDVGGLMGRGNTGVVLFYVISGFLLWRPFAAHLLGEAPAPNVRRYAVARALRIVPAYWVLLTLVILFSSRADPTPGGPLPYYLFAQSFDPDWKDHGIGQAWTLGVEVTFYALLPLLAVLAATMRNRAAGIWVIIAGCVVVSMAFKLIAFAETPAGGLGDTVWPWVLPWSLDEFAIGMALATLSVRPQGRPVIGARGAAAAWALAAVAFWIESTQVSEQTHGGAMARHLFDMVVALCLFLPAAFVVTQRSLPGRFLGWRPLLLLGVVSYSFYLVHLAILARADKLTDSPLVLAAMGLAASAVIAYFSYRFVELPALSLRRRWRRPDPSTGGRQTSPELT